MSTETKPLTMSPELLLAMRCPGPLTAKSRLALLAELDARTAAHAETQERLEQAQRLLKQFTHPSLYDSDHTRELERAVCGALDLLDGNEVEHLSDGGEWVCEATLKCLSPENAEVSPEPLPPADSVAPQNKSFSGEGQ